MGKNKGFGLIELMAVLGVLAIILAVAMPNFLGWRSDAQLRSVTEELRRAAKLAKSKAIQEGVIAVIDLDPDRDALYNSYLAFLDSDRSSDGYFSWQRYDSGEPVIYQQDVPESISIQLVDPATGEPSTKFRPEGKVLADRLLNIAVQGEKRRIEEKGVAGALFPADFHESKIHFKESPTTEGWWKLWYDGTELDYWIVNTEIMRKIIFYPNGECVTPVRIIVFNREGDKLMIEITNWTITKVTKIA